jgi:DNA/RNA endonuclease YhcR with UshA esterase domain
MQFVVALCVLLGACMTLTPAAVAGKPLTKEEARKKVNEEVTVELRIKTTKNRLEKRGEIYLDAEEDFRDESNLAIVINRAGAALFAQAGIADPAVHFKDKTVRVRGKVTVVDEVPRIVVEDPKQISVVEK